MRIALSRYALRAAFSSRPDWRVRCAKLGLDLVESDAARLQHHQQMIKHVGGFRDQAVAIVLADRGYRGFHRLLAQLLGAMVHAVVQQLAGVGHVRAPVRAGLHALFQIMERETRSCVFLSISSGKRG